MELRRTLGNTVIKAELHIRMNISSGNKHKKKAISILSPRSELDKVNFSEMHSFLKILHFLPEGRYWLKMLNAMVG